MRVAGLLAFRPWKLPTEQKQLEPLVGFCREQGLRDAGFAACNREDCLSAAALGNCFEARRAEPPAPWRRPSLSLIAFGNAAPRLVLTPRRSIRHGATAMGKRTGAREFPTDAEVEELARRVIENFPPGAAPVLAGYGIEPRDGIRFHPVATRCREARARRGLTIKSAARELRIPQYRLRDVENGQTNRIEPEVLARYLALLDLGRWFARWKAHNPELAAKLGATTIPGHGRTRASRRTGRREGAGVLQFKVRLQDIEPAVWRRIQVPADYTFWDLHVAIQDSMGWKDYHLHEFRLDETSPHEPLRIGIPDDELPHERPTLPGWEVRIAPYFTVEGARAAYLYDFGDSWEHVLEFEGVHPLEARGRYPRCVAGARACPPEDVGGTPGYEEFLAAVADPEHDQHEDMLRWVGGSFDPEAFSAQRVCFDDPRMRWRLAFARG